MYMYTYSEINFKVSGLSSLVSEFGGNKMVWEICETFVNFGVKIW